MLTRSHRIRSTTREGGVVKRTRMPQRRATPRRSERVRDHAFLSWVHGQRCMALELVGNLTGHVCEGGIEADHAGARPFGRKADDATCIPLCSRAHRERTDFSGAFRDFDKAAMRNFLAQAMAVIADRYARHQAVDMPAPP